MIVPTTVFFSSLPRDFISAAQMAITKSPSTRLPLSSTARQRSASPSNATPASRWFSLTYAIKGSMWVEPQLSLTLTPSGWFESIKHSAPSSEKSCSAVREAEPFAQSIAIFMPVSANGTVLLMWSI